MLIPGGTSLADRLLRRMGWRSEEIAEVVAEDEEQKSVVSKPLKGIFRFKCFFNLGFINFLDVLTGISLIFSDK